MAEDDDSAKKSKRIQESHNIFASSKQTCPSSRKLAHLQAQQSGGEELAWERFIILPHQRCIIGGGKRWEKRGGNIGNCFAQVAFFLFYYNNSFVLMKTVGYDDRKRQD